MNTVVLSLFVVAAAPVPKAPAADDVAPAAQIRDRLDEVGDVTIDQQNLSEAIGFFKNRLKCEIQLDASATNLAGIDPMTMTVSAKTHGKPHRLALKAALDPLGVTYAIVGDTLFIGTEEALLARQLRQAVSVDGKAANLAALLKSFADTTGANIVMDPRQLAVAEAAKVPLKLADVPLETAVRLAVEVGGLRTVRLNNVLFITSEARADKLRGDADGPVPMPSASDSLRLGMRLGGDGVLPAVVAPAAAVPALPVAPVPVAPPAPPK